MTVAHPILKLKCSQATDRQMLHRDHNCRHHIEQPIRRVGCYMPTKPPVTISFFFVECIILLFCLVLFLYTECDTVSLLNLAWISTNNHQFHRHPALPNSLQPFQFKDGLYSGWVYSESTALNCLQVSKSEHLNVDLSLLIFSHLVCKGHCAIFN